MGNDDREFINNICDEQNFEELLLEITSMIKSNKLNKILNDIENDNRLSKELKKSIYEDFFEYITELNQCYISGIKKKFCIGAKKTLDKIEEKNSMKGSKNMGIKTRVIIADDNVHICNFIKESLNKHDDIEILGVANTDEDEIRMIEELKPDIVITDLMRNYNYGGLDIIKNYFEKNSNVKFLVISADEKEDVINKGLEVAGYIKKPFTDYEIVYDEVKRIRKIIIDEEYNNWNEKYHNKKFIDLFMYFSPEQKEVLKKFDITLEEKLYTEFEFDVIDGKLILFYKNEDEMDEEELKECKELPDGVDRAQFNELVAVMSKVREKYNF